VADHEVEVRSRGIAPLLARNPRRAPLDHLAELNPRENQRAPVGEDTLKRRLSPALGRVSSGAPQYSFSGDRSASVTRRGYLVALRTVPPHQRWGFAVQQRHSP
jgi:hypothetical protein